MKQIFENKIDFFIHLQIKQIKKINVNEKYKFEGDKF